MGIVRASDIVWAFVGQITVIGDPSNWYAVSGASLVFLSGIILAIPKLLEARHEARLEKEGYENVADPQSSRDARISMSESTDYSDGVWSTRRFMDSPSSATHSEQAISVSLDQDDWYYQESARL